MLYASNTIVNMVSEDESYYTSFSRNQLAPSVIMFSVPPVVSSLKSASIDPDLPCFDWFIGHIYHRKPQALEIPLTSIYVISSDLTLAHDLPITQHKSTCFCVGRFLDRFVSYTVHVRSQYLMSYFVSTAKLILCFSVFVSFVSFLIVSCSVVKTFAHPEWH